MLTLRHNYLYNKMISESAKTNYFIKEWANSLKDTKLNKDQIVKILSNIDDIKVLKEISDYFYDNDGQRYIAYQPSDDSFINKANKENVVSKMADYIYKFICN